jgi:superfamily II DNA or RNA helicase
MEDYLRYEHYVMQTHASVNPDETVWHWSVVPEDELYACGFFHSFNTYRLRKKTESKKVNEYGLDGLSKNSEGVFTGLQAKCYTKSKLTAHHLGTFYQVVFMRMKEKDPRSLGYLYATCSLQADVRDDFLNSNTCFYEKLSFPEKEKTLGNETQYQLYDFQKEAVRALHDSEEQHGLLSVPCGLGKTLILSTWLAESQPPVVIMFSPTRQLAEQNHTRVSQFLTGYNHTMVACDAMATRDVDLLTAYMDSDQSVFFSSTYDSVDVIQEIMQQYVTDEFVLCIDECHNMSKELQAFVDIFEGRIVYMSATPRELLDIETVYSMDLSEAIEKNYITDYRVFLPTFEKDAAHVALENLDGFFGPRAEFLATGMLRKGSRRCIVYLNTKKDCEIFLECVQRLFKDYHGETFWGASIIDSTSSKRRQEILEAFSEDSNPSTFRVLVSVRILDEGIDIPKCDSIFIAQPSMSKSDSSHIRVVQRLNRATRKDAGNPSKVANCFIFAEEYDEVANVLQMLKNNDIHFGSKVFVMSREYEKAGGVETVEREGKALGELHNYIVSLKSMEDLWEEKFQLLQEFVGEFQRLPKGRETFYAVQLGDWCQTQQGSKNRDKLSTDRIRSLESVSGWVWTKTRLPWNAMFTLVQDFVREFDRLPKRCEVYMNVKLGDWVFRQQQERKNNNLSQERIEMLASISGWFWKRRVSWEDMYAMLQEFVKEFKRLPKCREIYHDTQLGIWVSTQKTMKKQNKISSARAETLEEISGWVWGYKIHQWGEMYTILQTFVREFERLPKTNEIYQDVDLWPWVYRQRQAKEANNLSSERVQMLMEIPMWIWTTKPSWDEVYRTLQSFVLEFKRLPKQREIYRDIKLSGWILTVKKERKNEKLSAQQITGLESIPGWSWEDIRPSWDEVYRTLQDFVMEFKRLPKTKEIFQGIKLGRWIETNCQSKKNRTLSDDKVKKLESLENWCW